MKDRQVCQQINQAIGNGNTGWPSRWPEGSKGIPADR